MGITPAIRIYHNINGSDMNDGLSPLTPVGTWNGVRQVMERLGSDKCLFEVVFMSDLWEDIYVDRPVKLTGHIGGGGPTLQPLITVSSAYLELNGVQDESGFLPSSFIFLLENLEPGNDVVDVNILGAETISDFIINLTIGNPLDNTFETFPVVAHQAVVVEEAQAGSTQIKVSGNLEENPHWSPPKLITFYMQLAPHIQFLRFDVLQGVSFDGSNTVLTLSEPLPYSVPAGGNVFLQVLTVDRTTFTNVHYKGEHGVYRVADMKFLKPFIAITGDTQVEIHDCSLSNRTICGGGLTARIEIYHSKILSGFIPVGVPLFIMPKTLIPQTTIRDSIVGVPILKTMPWQGFPGENLGSITELIVKGGCGVKNNLILFVSLEDMPFFFSQAAKSWVLSRLGWHPFSVVQANPPIPFPFRENLWGGCFINPQGQSLFDILMYVNKNVPGKYPSEGVSDYGKDPTPLDSIPPDFEVSITDIKRSLAKRWIKIL